jgi:hypothetical protein
MLKDLQGLNDTSSIEVLQNGSDKASASSQSAVSRAVSALKKICGTIGQYAVPHQWAVFSKGMPAFEYNDIQSGQQAMDRGHGYPRSKYNWDVLSSQPGEHHRWRWFPMLFAIGGGTGASIGGTGSTTVDRDLLRRMHYQDKAVMFLVLVVYLVALAFSANLTYRQATNNSPVTYYADPRFHNYVMEGHELDVFLETFNQAPKNITLQVAGFVPVQDDMHESVRWRGENFQVAFTFSLDLSPWVVREIQTQTPSTGPSQLTRSLQDGMLPEDRSTLQHVLMHDGNDTSYVELEKEVAWPGWEELATNIKHQIRQRGFSGVISVDRTEKEELRIYKNRPWANFMHSRATRVLCALSVIGWLIYVPYMWIRCRKIGLRSHFRVDVNISDYWALIEDKLCRLKKEPS